MTNRRSSRILAFGAPLVAAAMLLAACGSDDDDAGTTAPPSAGSTGGSSTGGSSAPADDPQAAAAARIAPLLGDAKGIGLTEPLTKAPEKGLTIGFISDGLARNDAFQEPYKAAAALFGWDVKVFSFQFGDPQGANSAMLQAVQSKVDFITTIGLGEETVGEGIAAAKAAGIGVYVFTSPQDADPAKGVTVAIDGTPATQVSLVDYAIARGGSDVHMLALAFRDAPVAAAAADVMKTHAAKECSTCTYTELPFTFGDVTGGAIPGLVVSAVQRDPKISYISFPFDETYLGVPEALAAAGIGKDIKFLNNAPGPDVVKLFGQGKIDAFIGFADWWYVWMAVDAMARDSIGQKYDVATYRNVGYGIWTQDDHPAVIPTNGYRGPAGFEDAFKKLWLMG